ncbi:MAG: hypothetical protein SFU83_12505 [Meiothermus sp.]|nr:hypothetical protein [Meiothermus sp.]
MKGRLLADDGRAVVVALDHALASGQVPPLDHPKPLLDSLLEARPDGLILTHGMTKLVSPGAVGQRWLTADYYATSTLPGAGGEHEIQDQIWSAATARALGATGLKVLLVFGRHSPEVFLRNVRYVSSLIDEAR